MWSSALAAEVWRTRLESSTEVKDQMKACGLMPVIWSPISMCIKAADTSWTNCPVYSLTPLHMLIRISANAQTLYEHERSLTAWSGGKAWSCVIWSDLICCECLMQNSLSSPWRHLASSDWLDCLQAEETFHIEIDFLKSNLLHSLAPEKKIEVTLPQQCY